MNTVTEDPQADLDAILASTDPTVLWAYHLGRVHGARMGWTVGWGAGWDANERDAAAAWAPVAASVREIGKRPGPLGPPRTTYTTAPKSAAQIRAEAARSWAQVETTISRGAIVREEAAA